MSPNTNTNKHPLPPAQKNEEKLHKQLDKWIQLL
jgi:hypothetical protein